MARRSIRVANPSDDSFLAHLGALYTTFSVISKGEVVEFDLSNLRWACPLSILPLSAYINSTGSSYVLPAQDNPKGYLATINFPRGIFTIETLQGKTYIPITILKRREEERREKLKSLFQHKIMMALGSQTAKNAIYQPLDELAVNVIEHSRASEGQMLAQYYGTKRFLDVCIVDSGRGIAASYLEEKNVRLSDKSALQNAMQGISTKPGNDRGYGLHTSKDIICHGLEGEFIVISGSEALFFDKTSKAQSISLNDFYWQGTIIAYRIKRPTKTIDIYRYLE